MATPDSVTLIEVAEPLVAEPVGAFGVPKLVRVTVKVAIPSEVTLAVELSGFVFKIMTRNFFPESLIFSAEVV